MYHELKKNARYLTYVALGVWGVAGTFAGYDIYNDLVYHAPWSHILVEMTMALASILAAMLLIYGISEVMVDAFRRFERDEARAQQEISKLADHNQRLMAQLSERIFQQFAAWKLSEAEVEIGFLLIKGYSLKEIAAVRHTSERTVREQARKIYKKSNLSGRSALSALFLEELFVPTID